MPAQTDLGYLGLLAETQHHATLTLLHDVETGKQPHHERHRDDQAGADTARAAGAGVSAATALAAAEQAAELLLQAAHNLVEVGPAFDFSASPGVFAPGRSGFIPGHDALLKILFRSVLGKV